MATIYFIMISETMDEHELYVDYPETGVRDSLYGKWITPKYIRAGIPVGEDIGALARELAEFNGIKGPLPRESRLRVSKEASLLIQKIAAVEEGPVRFQTRVILPPVLDVVETILEGTDEGQELVEGILEEAGTRRKVINRAVEMGKQAPHVPRRTILAASILREYKLYGDGPADNVAVTDADLDEILGFAFVADEAPEAPEPPGPRAVARIPYEDFDLGEPTGCLTKGLIAKYSGLGASKKISAASIEAWFSEENGGPSLERLKEFAERYKIPLRVYDITGTEIHALTRRNAGETTGGRPGLAILAWNNHAYFYKKSLNDLPSFREALEHDVQGFFDSRAMKLATQDGEMRRMTEEESEILSQAVALDKPNFSYIAEQFVGGRNLMWSERSEAVEQNESAQWCCWDMNKAYHTAVMATKETCPGLAFIFNRQRIPIFSAMDDYKEATAVPVFPQRAVWDITYFFLSKEALRRLREAKGTHAGGRISNMLTGMEYTYLLGRGLIQQEDIEGWKTASYAIPESKFRRWLSSLDKPIGPEDLLPPLPGGVTRSLFALMNGLMGRSWTRPQEVCLATDNSMDVDLLTLTHSAMTEEVLRSGETPLYSLVMPAGTRKYLYLNCKHFYNHVIGRMNLMMMKAADDIAERNPDASLIKIKVDALAYDMEVSLPEWAVPLFKREEPTLLGHAYEGTYHSVSELAASVSAEVRDLVSRCVTYTGAPGTGKTTTVQNEHQYDCALAFSNVCARNLDAYTKEGRFVKGETLHAGLGLHRLEQIEMTMAKLKDKVLWVDEFSTVQSWVWSVLVALLARGLKVLILTGDPNQTAPVMESFRDKSTLMRELMGGAEKLTVDYRNDSELIKLRDFVIDTPESNKGRIVKFLNRLCAARPSVSGDGLSFDQIAAVDVHIVHTNALRMVLNQAILEARGLTFKKAADAGAGPTKWVASKGIRLRARVTRKRHSVYKGALYELCKPVLRTSRRFTVKRIYLDAGKAPDAEMELPIAEFAAFEPGYALTAHSSIGQTVKGQKMFVHQIAQMVEIDKKILYVAITRACALSELIFCMGVPAPIAEKRESLLLAAEEADARPPPDDEPEVLTSRALGARLFEEAAFVAPH